MPSRDWYIELFLNMLWALGPLQEWLQHFLPWFWPQRQIQKVMDFLNRCTDQLMAIIAGFRAILRDLGAILRNLRTIRDDLQAVRDDLQIVRDEQRAIRDEQRAIRNQQQQILNEQWISINDLQRLGDQTDILNDHLLLSLWRSEQSNARQTRLGDRLEDLVRAVDG